MILVTGATGKIGSEVTKQLSALGVPVRAMVRGPEAAPVAGSQVEMVQGDLMKPETLDAPLQGIEKVFLLSPQGGDPYQMESPLVEAAKRAGVRHIVKLAVLGASPFSHVGFVRSHWQTEKLIEGSGMAFTFLQPNHLMQHFVAVFAPTIAMAGAFYAPMKDGKVSMVDARDIAAVAVAALTKAGHEGKVYDITGPEALSYREAAEKLSQALGKQVTYVDMPAPATRQFLIETQHVPEFVADDVVGLYGYFAEGYAERVTDVVQRVAGKQPFTFDQFAHDFAPAFQGR